LNENTENKCTRCKDEKKVYVEKSNFGGANSKKRNADRTRGYKPARKPMKEEEKKQAGIFS